MGYDIYALDDKENEIAYLRAYMGAFRMCREQGYDWFKLIDAEDQDGEVSGRGGTKKIKLTNLQNAMKALLKHNTRGVLTEEGRDKWSHRKPLLQEFMQKCIDYCKNNNKKTIRILFC